MQEIATAIHEGAMVFLKREYQILAVFVLVVFALLGWFINGSTATAFLAGAACSMLAGYFGMEAATRANVRTAQAASQHGEARALMLAFSGGAVMGLSADDETIIPAADIATSFPTFAETLANLGAPV